MSIIDIKRSAIAALDVASVAVVILFFSAVGAAVAALLSVKLTGKAVELRALFDCRRSNWACVRDRSTSGRGLSGCDSSLTPALRMVVVHPLIS